MFFDFEKLDVGQIAPDFVVGKGRSLRRTRIFGNGNGNGLGLGLEQSALRFCERQ